MENLEGLGVRAPTGNASRTNASVNWNIFSVQHLNSQICAYVVNKSLNP